MQNPFAKPLDKSFVDFFAKIEMQSLFAKPLELLLGIEILVKNYPLTVCLNGYANIAIFCSEFFASQK
jgi:hypothetical protein